MDVLVASNKYKLYLQKIIEQLDILLEGKHDDEDLRTIYCFLQDTPYEIQDMVRELISK